MRSWPAPTIRLRLTVLYGLMFLVSGAVLLTIGYLLVRHNLDTPQDVGVELRKLGTPPPGATIQFGTDSSVTTVADAIRNQLRGQELNRLLYEYALALGVMTMVSVGAGWVLAGRALRPLRRITATARRVSGENLGERIDLAGPADELKQLADTFDGMLARLDSAFASQRHFVANASHELRTPLAIMRTELDVALADERATAADLRAMGEAVRDTIDGCERLISSLLTLARSEASRGRAESVDLGAIAADCVTDLRARAEEADVKITAELAPAWIVGDPGLLERMLANLLDNGVRHNEPGGRLLVRTGATGASARLEVANDGAVIDPAEAATLSEPFRRLDRRSSGFGLGLSIVRTVAEAHNGAIEIAAPPAGGLRVEIALPALTTPPQPLVSLTKT